MGTDAAPAAAAPAKEKVKREGPPRSYGITLSGAAGETLRFLAIAKKDGTVTTRATHIVRDAKGKVTESTPGATDQHENMDEARKAINKGVELAMKDGWTQRRGGGGYKAKPDKFDIKSLPKPGQSAKGKK